MIAYGGTAGSTCWGLGRGCNLQGLLSHAHTCQGKLLLLWHIVSCLVLAGML